MFLGPFHKITCYRGDWVNCGSPVLDIALTARDFKDRTYFSERVRWMFYYFHARDINHLAWKASLALLLPLAQ